VQTEEYENISQYEPLELSQKSRGRKITMGNSAGTYSQQTKDKHEIEQMLAEEAPVIVEQQLDPELVYAETKTEDEQEHPDLAVENTLVMSDLYRMS
jgi:hypothetical protein